MLNVVTVSGLVMECAVRQKHCSAGHQTRKKIIQDVQDYFQRFQLLHKGGVYRFVSVETTKLKVAEFNKKRVVIKGTIKVH